MDKHAFSAIVSLAILSGCVAPPDDPSNIPLKGKWSDESRLLSVSRNGGAMSVEQFEESIGEKIELPPSDQFCGEPTFADRQSLQEALHEGDMDKCDITSMDVKGATVNSKAICPMTNIPGVEGSSTLTHKIRMKTDTVDFDVIVDSMGRDQRTGAGEAIRLEFRRTMTRIGDC
jgi:hypothetical protein